MISRVLRKYDKPLMTQNKGDSAMEKCEEYYSNSPYYLFLCDLYSSVPIVGVFEKTVFLIVHHD